MHSTSPSRMRRCARSIGEIVDDAKRRAVAVAQPRDAGGVRRQQPRIFLARVAVLELARMEIEHARERGDEQCRRVVARHLGVHLREQRAEIGAAVAQHRALAQRLADGHEDARRQAFPRHVTEQEEQPPLVEPVEIVEVATDVERRLHRRGEIDARILQRLGARQRVELDPLCGLHLAGHARALLPLPLDDFLQRLAVARRRGERHRDERAEQQHDRERRRRGVEQQTLRTKRRVRGEQDDRHQRERDRRHVADGPLRRHPHEQRAQQQHDQRLDQRGHGRADEKCVLRHVLQQLRVDLDARDLLADRRPDIVADAQVPSRRPAPSIRAIARFRRCRSGRPRPTRSGSGRDAKN